MPVGTVVICKKTKAFAKICNRRQGRMNINTLDFKPVRSPKKTCCQGSRTQWDGDASLTTKIPEKDTYLHCIMSPTNFVLGANTS